MRFTSLLLVCCFFLSSFLVEAQNDNHHVIIKNKYALLKTQELLELKNIFQEQAVIYGFPKKNLAKGIDEITAYFEALLKAEGKQDITSTKVISFKGILIVKEQIQTKNGQTERIVFYKFKKNKIKSMTILHQSEATPERNVTGIVDEQLTAYNRRDIAAFVRTYATNVEVFTFPNRSQASGHAGLRQDYTSLFENTTNLHCQIENRIVLGNVVIDKESVTANSNTFGAVAIYQIEDDLISKVTFIQ